MKKNILCKNCRLYYRSGESTAQKKFVDGEVEFLGPPPGYEGEWEPIEVPCGDLVAEGPPFSIKMCQHRFCFENEIAWDPVFGQIEKKIRINGQGFLNKNGECPHFIQKPWWKFW